MLIGRETLIAQVRAMLRDVAGERWSATEFELAINQVMADWVGRVSVPVSAPATFVAGTLEYALPEYVQGGGGLHPQWRDDEGIWHDYMAYTVQSDGEGAFLLRFFGDPGSRVGRMIYWIANGMWPLGDSVLAGSLASDGESVAISAENAPAHGFVRIGDEWVQWAGVERGATVRLLNLRRGQYGTVAAAHNAGAGLEWGIALPSAELMQVLGYQLAATLHRMYLSDGSAQERSQHERMVAYYDGQVMQFWRRWTPRRPRVRVGDSPVWREIPGYGYEHWSCETR